MKILTYKNLLIFVFFVLAAVILYMAYGVMMNRYYGSKNENLLPIRSEEAQQNENSATLELASQNDAPENVEGGNPAGTKLYIESSDCDQGCERYKDNAENFRYCQEVCGVKPVKTRESKDDCANLAGLEKDYCFRDLAVSKKDASICNDILDSRIKSVCKNRTLEEILDQ